MSPQKCHLPVPFYMVLTHLVATFLSLQDAPTPSEFRLGVSSLQPTCSPVAHEDDGDSLLFYFPLC